jgi:RNA polymerase sigma factor (sigma-70 family)
MATAQLSTLMRHLRGLAVGPHRTDRQLLDDFSARRDESAFTELLSRHGPMVLRVCRRVLRHEQDAEDAFQAAFLVLARQTESIRRRETLASWLYGVAFRTAMEAKRKAGRRRKHEARLRERTSLSTPSPTWDDVQAVLDEEIGRLPEPFRAAFVLCVLEGQTVPSAAAELGAKEGTVSWRLARARQQLRQRLVRRGIELATVLAVLSVADGSGEAAVPVALTKTTIGIGLSVAAGGPAAEIPSHVAALAAGVTRAMFFSKAKIATALLVVLGLTFAGASTFIHRALATPPEEAKLQTGAKPPAAVKPAPAEEKDGLVEVRGRVLDPASKPVKGAQLIFVYGSARKVPEKVWATSAADGRFEFTVAKAVLDDPWYENNRRSSFIVAAAEGHGVAATPLALGDRSDLTLRLTKDDVPLQGRVLDLQGKPVVGATVRIDDMLYLSSKGDLTAWLEELQAGKLSPGQVEAKHLMGLWSPAFSVLFPPTKTDADGQFEIKGLGRERVVGLRIDGPTIATRRINAMTRHGDTIRVPEEIRQKNRRATTYYGTGFDLVVPPTKPIVGVVRDKATGQPLAGITVRTYIIREMDVIDENLIHAQTDKDGRYRLVGLPKAPGNRIVARADELPYLPAVETVADTPGLEPVSVDFALHRGVWVTGRVTDKITGEPVAAGVECFPFLDNPHAKDVPLFDPNWCATKEDGRFRTVALPGPGIITVRAAYDRYCMGVGAERIPGHRVENVGLIQTRPIFILPGNYHVLVPIDPEPGAESIPCDVVLDPGRTLAGRVVGPDGQPLAGARVSGQKAMNFWDSEPLKGAEFTMLSLGDDESRLIQVLHEGKQLVGSLVVSGKDKGPVDVPLQPWGSVTGRLVTPDGEPLTGVEVAALGSSKKEAPRVGFLPGPARPGKDGRFRLDGLAPGLNYNLSVMKDNYGLETDGPSLKVITIKTGESRDLGDIHVKPRP